MSHIHQWRIRHYKYLMIVTIINQTLFDTNRTDIHFVDIRNDTSFCYQFINMAFMEIRYSNITHNTLHLQFYHRLPYINNIIRKRIMDKQRINVRSIHISQRCSHLFSDNFIYRMTLHKPASRIEIDAF